MPIRPGAKRTASVNPIDRPEPTPQETAAKHYRVRHGFMIQVTVQCDSGKEVEILARLSPRERALRLIGVDTDGSYINRMRRLYVTILNVLLTHPKELWTFQRIQQILGVDTITAEEAILHLTKMGNISHKWVRTNTKVNLRTYFAISDVINFDGVDWENLDLGEFLHTNIDDAYDAIVHERPYYYDDQQAYDRLAGWDDKTQQVVTDSGHLTYVDGIKLERERAKKFSRPLFDVDWDNDQDEGIEVDPDDLNPQSAEEEFTIEEEGDADDRAERKRRVKKARDGSWQN